MLPSLPQGVWFGESSPTPNQVRTIWCPRSAISGSEGICCQKTSRQGRRQVPSQAWSHRRLSVRLPVKANLIPPLHPWSSLSLKITRLFRQKCQDGVVYSRKDLGKNIEVALVWVDKWNLSRKKAWSHLLPRGTKSLRMPHDERLFTVIAVGKLEDLLISIRSNF